MKKLLAIVLVLALCLSLFALVACECDHEWGDDGKCTKCGAENPDKPSGGGDVDVPVAEGKVTLYLTVAEDSVDIPEYGGIYFTGGQTGWVTTDAPLMTKLGDSNVYYVQIEYDPEKGQTNEYKVSLGYAPASGLPADKLGIRWNLCSDEGPDGGDNAVFTYTAGATKIDLGTHTFSTELDAPERIAAVDLRITFAAPLAADAEVYIVGDFIGWDISKAKATPNAERDVYSLHLTDVLCTGYSYKVLVYEHGAEADGIVTKEPKLDEQGNPVLDDQGQPVMNDVGIWDRYFEDASEILEGITDAKADGKVIAYVEISAGGGNLPVDIKKYHGAIGYVDLAGTVSETIDDVVKSGIDLSEAQPLEGEKIVDEVNVGNGVYKFTYSLAAVKTLVAKFDKKVEGMKVYIVGDFTGWSFKEMELAEDGLSASYVYETLPGNIQYKVCIIGEDVEEINWDTTAGHCYGVKDNALSLALEAGNIPCEVKGFTDGEVELWDGTFAVPEAAPAE